MSQRYNIPNAPKDRKEQPFKSSEGEKVQFRAVQLMEFRDSPSKQTNSVRSCEKPI